MCLCVFQVEKRVNDTENVVFKLFGKVNFSVDQCTVYMSWSTVLTVINMIQWRWILNAPSDNIHAIDYWIFSEKSVSNYLHKENSISPITAHHSFDKYPIFCEATRLNEPDIYSIPKYLSLPRSLTKCLHVWITLNESGFSACST